MKLVQPLGFSCECGSIARRSWVIQFAQQKSPANHDGASEKCSEVILDQHHLGAIADQAVQFRDVFVVQTDAAI